LLDAGWRVAIVWGCALKGWKKHQDDDAFIGELATWLISGQSNTLELSINV
jgi:G:T-mismatch repair DNA endonuclease (very short patch repair protein)